MRGASFLERREERGERREERGDRSEMQNAKLIILNF